MVLFIYHLLCKITVPFHCLNTNSLSLTREILMLKGMVKKIFLFFPLPFIILQILNCSSFLRTSNQNCLQDCRGKCSGLGLRFPKPHYRLWVLKGWVEPKPFVILPWGTGRLIPILSISCLLVPSLLSPPQSHPQFTSRSPAQGSKLSLGFQWQIPWSHLSLFLPHSTLTGSKSCQFRL